MRVHPQRLMILAATVVIAICAERGAGPEHVNGYARYL